MGRRALKGTVVSAMCAAALAGGAQAGTDVVSSKVSLEVKRDVRFKGTVKSPASDCAIGRKVLLYRAKPGRNQKIAKAFTSESGKYAVTIPMQHGNRIYALVRRVRTPLDTICKRARSPAVTV
jgi:hypothetical protein